MREICRDLAKEQEELDALVAPLDDAGWDKPTPAEGWAIRDQINHLAYFDDRARLSAMDPDAFAKHLQEALRDLQGFADGIIQKGRRMSPAELLAWWRKERAKLIEAFQTMDPKARVPWYGPSMSVRSSATARLMETWAHGQDVADALGVRRTPTDRLKHIAHLGVSTFGWSYANRKLNVPDTAVRVELTSPSGEPWTWGPENSEDRVRGSAEEFCLVVAQRRHPSDTALQVTGPVASEWISIAQCFAGPPGKGRKPGQF
jgi:uncharacterized protein (TIGR03084 family)